MGHRAPAHRPHGRRLYHAVYSVAAPSIIWTPAAVIRTKFLLRTLDAADKMDALERIVLLEEPFAGDRPEPVRQPAGAAR